MSCNKTDIVTTSELVKINELKELLDRSLREIKNPSTNINVSIKSLLNEIEPYMEECKIPIKMFQEHVGIFKKQQPENIGLFAFRDTNSLVASKLLLNQKDKKCLV